MRWLFGELSIMAPRCKLTTRTAIFVVHSLLLSCTTTALSASQCDPASIAVASHLRLARASQNSIDHANNANCRAYFKEFVEAVTARQTAVTCQDGLGRHRALELIDAEIQRLNDRIAEQLCEP
jgi:hypothetical protein